MLDDRRHELKRLPREDLAAFLSENLRLLSEEEVLAVLDNPFVTPAICQQIAREPRLTAYTSVRLRLVAHRQTPQAHASKLVHYLYWPDLVRLSIDVTVPSQVRRAIDTQLLLKVGELAAGEKISAARRCSPALIKVFLFDPDPRVFEALLVNQRLREDDLLSLVNSTRATPEQLRLLGADRKWSYRYAIRKALVMNSATPRSTAAAQLRFLTPRDLAAIYANRDTSTYIRRCIERLRPQLPAASGRNGG